MEKTNAMRILDKAKIDYIPHTYDASDGQIDGMHVAQKCGIDPKIVYKTLVTQGHDHNYYVFVIPVEKELNLKACAAIANVKSVEMIHVKDINKITGYIRGGCSPVGMKKKYKTFYDEDIQTIDSVYVSGGKIGTQIEIHVSDLLSITEGIVGKLTQ